MNTLIDFIKIILLIGLIIYVYFALIKKLSNNYKVLILPFITLINSIIFGYKAYSNDDDINLIIWLVIFLTSLLLFVLVIRKINSEKHKPIQTTINNTEINHNYNTNIDTIDYSNTFQNSQTNNHLEQINNVTNIERKPQSKHKKKDNNFIDLDNVKLEQLYKNLLKYDVINNNIELNIFINKFLKEPISFNNLSLPEYNLFFKKLEADFFINISDKGFCKLFNLNYDSLKNSKKYKDYHYEKIEKIFEKV